MNPIISRGMRIVEGHTVKSMTKGIKRGKFGGRSITSSKVDSFRPHSKVELRELFKNTLQDMHSSERIFQENLLPQKKIEGQEIRYEGMKSDQSEGQRNEETAGSRERSGEDYSTRDSEGIGEAQRDLEDAENARFLVIGLVDLYNKSDDIETFLSNVEMLLTHMPTRSPVSAVINFIVAMAEENVKEMLVDKSLDKISELTGVPKGDLKAIYDSCENLKNVMEKAGNTSKFLEGESKKI